MISAVFMKNFKNSAKDYFSQKYPNLSEEFYSDLDSFVHKEMPFGLKNELGERVKELSCLHDVSRIIRNRDFPIEEICKAVVKRIPQAMQFSSLTYALIRLKNHPDYIGGDYADTPYFLKVDIAPGFFSEGELIVGYNQKPNTVEHIFLKEEEALLDSLAELLGAAIESRRYEEAVLESENKYRRFFKTAAVVLMRISKNGEILEANEAFAKMFGINDLGKALHSNSYISDYFCKTDAFDGFMQAIRNEESFVQTTLLGREPDLKAETEAFKVSYKNEPYYELIIKDISQREIARKALMESEQKFKTIFENINDAVGLHKIENGQPGTFLEVNKTAIRMFGYTREEFSRMTPDMILGESLNERLETYYQQLLQQGRARVETYNVTKDGRRIPVEIQAIIFEMHGDKYLTAVTRDISERQEAEARIKDSEQRYKMLSNLTFEGIVLHRNGVLVDANQRAFEMFGYTREQLIGKQILPLVFDKESVPIILAQIKNNYAKPYMVTGIHKDNSQIPIEIEARNLTETSDNPLRVAAIRDMRERLKARAAIEQAHKELEQLNEELKVEKELAQKYLETAGVLMLVLDKKGYVRMANAEAARVLECPKEEIEGKHWFSEFISSNDRKALDSLFKKHISDKFSSGHHYKNTIITAKGNTRTIQWNNVYLENQFGEHAAVLSSGLDITRSELAQKKIAENERKFSSIFNYSGIAIALGDPDGNILQTNTVFRNMTGYSEKELSQLHFSQLTHPDDLEKEFKLLDKLMKGEIKHYSIDKRYITKQKKVIWVEANITIIRDDKEQPLWFVGMINDLTERVSREEILEKNQEQLRELNATKDKFLSIIAHDLKNPLAQILGFSDLLMKNIKNEKYEKIYRFSEIINQSVSEADKLLDNLLQWSRAQTGRIRFKPVRVNLSLLIAEVIESQQTAAYQKDITVYDLTSGECSAMADRNMMHTVLRNLLSNAIKFTPRGGEIQLYVNRSEAECSISVADTGVGMSKETIQGLFNIEENVSSPGTDKEKGTGLGLLICKEFVQKHGGTISVDSAPGKGSVFEVRLPLK